jgi:hypothetical protein
MAQVQSKYGGGYQQPQASVLATLMDAWTGERKAMNDEARGNLPDAEKLATMELSARRNLAEMERDITRARSMDNVQKAQLATEMAKGYLNMGVASINARASVDRQKLALQLGFAEMATREADELGLEVAVTDETREAYANIAKDLAGDPANVGERAAALLTNLMQKERAGPFGSAKADAMVAALYTKMVQEGGRAAADVMARKLQPTVKVSPPEYWVERHSPPTRQAMREEADDINRQISAGGDPAVIARALKDLFESNGLDFGDALAGADSILETEGGATGGTSPRGGGGAVSMRGNLSPQALAALRDAPDPYAGLVAAAAAERAFVDDLAKRRQAASTARSTFPRANPYLANPNTYTRAQDTEAAERVGDNDPGLNREWADAGLRTATDRGARREIAESGGIEKLYGARLVEPMDVEDGGDLGAWLADAFSQDGPVEGPGGYVYTFGAGGDITITKTPKGKPGAVVKVGTPEHDAILAEVGDAHPPTAALRVLAAQPAEVRAKFGVAARAVAAGRLDTAAKAARLVDADDVRYAYGTAATRASRSPADVAGLATGINALPETVRAGGWTRPFDDTVVNHRATQMRGGHLADAGALGTIANYGRALQASPKTRAARDVPDASRDPDDDLRTEGATRAKAALDRATTDDERAKVRDTWAAVHARAPSPVTEAAMGVLGTDTRQRATRIAQPATYDLGGDVATIPGHTPIQKDPGDAFVPDPDLDPSALDGAEPPDDDADFATFLSTPDDAEDEDFAAFLKEP